MPTFGGATVLHARERFGIDVRRASAELPRLPAVVQRVARLCDGVRTVEAVCASSSLEPAQTARVLERLARLGVISPANVVVRERRELTPDALVWLRGAPDTLRTEAIPAAEVRELAKPDAFSHEEESFFASPIDHLVEQY